MIVFVAPGGSLQQDAGSENGITRCVVCVFSAADEPAILKSYYEVSVYAQSMNVNSCPLSRGGHFSLCS